MHDRLLTNLLTTRAAADTPSARVRVVQYDFSGGCDAMLPSDGSFRLEHALSARHVSTQGCYPAHWREGRFQRIGETFIVAPGQNLRVRCEPTPQPLEAIICHIDRELFFDMYVDNFGSHRAYPFKEGDAELYLPVSLDLQNSRIRALMTRMADETRRPGIATKFMLSAITIQLVIELLRDGAKIGAPKQKGGLATWQLRLIEERLNQPGSAPTLPELAGLCHISVRHLTRAFKESRGYTIGGFVTQRHMDHAKSLLAQRCSVASIAADLGFASSSSFCATFRRETGFTPAQFSLNFLNGLPARTRQPTSGTAGGIFNATRRSLRSRRKT
jgi:AraC family transcriptional regulator